MLPWGGMSDSQRIIFVCRLPCFNPTGKRRGTSNRTSTRGSTLMRHFRPPQYAHTDRSKCTRKGSSLFPSSIQGIRRDRATKVKLFVEVYALKLG